MTAIERERDNMIHSHAGTCLRIKKADNVQFTTCLLRTKFNCMIVTSSNDHTRKGSLGRSMPHQYQKLNFRNQVCTYVHMKVNMQVDPNTAVVPSIIADGAPTFFS